MDASVLVLFPHQLFHQNLLIKDVSTIFLLEEPHFFSRFAFHKQKILLHRASMKAYEKSLQDGDYTVVYRDHELCKKGLKSFFLELCKKKVEYVHYYDVVDHELEEQIVRVARQCSVKLIKHESPSFILSSNQVVEFLGDKKRYMMASFYQKVRKLTGILMKNGKPVGGRWSFDAYNRQPYDDSVRLPSLPSNNMNAFVQKAREYVKRSFAEHPGSTDTFIYPITHQECKKWLALFIRKKLAQFGDYQDAIDKEHPFGFHSILSPLLNCGLLVPQEVIDAAILYADSHDVPLASLEGFVRQIIGWREFVRGVYTIAGEKQRKSNIFCHKRKLPKSFWNASTGITPIDVTIKHVLNYAYAHHIERLMILSNFMLLRQTKPDDVYQWFMEMFIDAYDWVMIPNVYGMGQYADGGMITTKPYCSGSRYILTMSNYQKGPWCDLWDALYWKFIYDHRKLFMKNARMGLMLAGLKKMNKQKLHDYLEKAKKETI